MPTENTLNLAGGVNSHAVLGASVTEGKPGDQVPNGKEHHSDKGGIVFALAFWVLILGLGAFWYFRSEKADVLLNVDASRRLAVSGSVLVSGLPADNGRVHVVVNDEEKRYLASVVIPVEAGSFKHDGLLPDESAARSLRIAATYHGVLKSGSTSEPIAGTAAAFVNVPAPLDGGRVLSTLGLMFSLILVLIVLFTGELTRLKARALFAVTYLMTFLSLAVPIAATIIISQNNYLVELMKRSPIGLVRGKTAEMDANAWLLNIGGTQVSVTPAARTATPRPTADPAAPAGAPADAAEQVPQATADANSQPAAGATVDPQAAAADNQGSAEAGAAGAGAGAAAVATGGATQSAADSRALAPATYAGGLAVPFYIVMLAMLGAGINMTRQVPKIQAAYDEKIVPRRESMLLAFLHAPGSMFRTTIVTDPKEREAAAYIRKQLIDSYMYLLAAPFLAIAVYYLLQVIANNTATPVLVLMAFATGLTSDAIVSRITAFAERTIGKLSPEEPARPAGEAVVVEQVQGNAAGAAPAPGANEAAEPPAPAAVPAALPFPGIAAAAAQADAAATPAGTPAQAAAVDEPGLPQGVVAQAMEIAAAAGAAQIVDQIEGALNPPQGEAEPEIAPPADPASPAPNEEEQV